MRRPRSSALALACLLGFALVAEAQLPIRQYVLQNAATSAVGGTVAHVSGFTVAAVQIFIASGSAPHAIIVFEQALSATHYTAGLCNPIDGGASHSGVSIMPNNSATVALSWRCNVTGANWFRARLHSISGGQVSVYATLLPGGSAHAIASMGWLT